MAPVECRIVPNPMYLLQMLASTTIRAMATYLSWSAKCFVLASLLIAGCATPPRKDEPAPRRPSEIRAEITRLLPATTKDREGWATDITAAFAAIGIEPSTSNLCAVLAVTEQESTFSADPKVAGLGRIARAEIDRRAADKGIPQLIVRAGLAIKSTNGKSYGDRIASLRSEREMSLLYEDMIGRLPLGQRLFGSSNPVRTGGPMQVSISYAEQYVSKHGYPYPLDGSIRNEVFSRRGGMYFGIAHLLDYEVSYDKPLYRFADFNAGHYASRNAAFQNAVVLASGIPLALDGDLIIHGSDKIGATELAVRSLSKHIDLSDARIRRALEQGDRADFAETALYKQVFAFAERSERKTLPRAVMPRIDLKSPKITRKLTTEWFATRVDQRHQRCMAKTGANPR